MKTALIILCFLIIAFMIILFILGVVSRSEKAPRVIEGSLSKCPDKPNCVCSEQKDDIHHYIDPIAIPQNTTFDTSSVLKNVIQEMGGHIQDESDNYLAATFSSAIFRFVDDLEIRIDPSQKVIHIRAASRVGYSDMGVNRNRAELLKKRYGEKTSEAKQ